MNRLIVQVYRGEEWRKVTSIEFDANRTSPLVRGSNIVHTRSTAMREGISALTAWSGYFLEPLRLVERIGYYGSEETVVLGGRS